MSYCPLAFRMSMFFFYPQPLISKQSNDFHDIFMKFIYGNGVMMHVKTYKDVIGCREVIAL